MNSSHRTTRRLAALAASCAVGALVVGPVVPVTAIPADLASDASQSGDAELLRLTVTSVEFGSADVGEPGDSIGDLSAWTDNLSAKGRKVGHAGTSCERTSTELGESNCVSTLILDGRGTITIQGIASDTGGYPFEVAVTGGSEEFAGVGGNLTIDDVAGHPNKLRILFRLTR